MHAVAKYLAGYAEPEIGLAKLIDRRYERALVVPAFRERATLVDGFVRAAETSPGRTLAVVVVNAPADAAVSAHAENERLIADLVARLERVDAVSRTPRAWLGAGHEGSLDVLVVDRASEGARLPPKRGVGLARKIGADLALALHVSGVVRSSWIFGSDADATLPDGHFDVSGIAGESDAAIVFPFWHEPGPDAAVTRATAIYELSIRYYAAGLAWARSPFAFHTLGSATAVSAPAYAMVRGYPRREAAEDFYLLNKIAKVGPVVRSPGHAVRLESRASARTPFGTGRGVMETLSGGERDFYSPEVFSVLKALLHGVEAFSETGDIDAFYEKVGGLPPGPRAVVSSLLEKLGACSVLAAASRELPARGAKRLRVHSWFDAFRTLKLVHALRDRCFPSMPWRGALAGAPFFGHALSEDDGEAVANARAHFDRTERELPRRTGPAAFGVY